MTTDAVFCGIDLARRIEGAEAQFMAAATNAAGVRGAPASVRPVGGGFACFAEPGSPMNKVVGVGFGAIPEAAEWAEIEAGCAANGAPVQVELANLADPGIGRTLTGRGYRLVGFENVLGRAVAVGTDPVVAGVEVRRSDDINAWVEVVVDGFAHPDDQGVASHEEFPRGIVERAERDIEKAGAAAYLASIDGVVAGGAAARFADGIAQLAGAATRPDYRRRGVQSALLAKRLADAAAAGCDIAVVTTGAGTKSQQNVQRFGFQLLYTRAILVFDRERSTP